MVGGIFVFYTPLGERPLRFFLPVSNIPIIEFPALELTDNPNQYLLCPKGYCKTKPHANSPLFQISAKELQAAWQKLMSAQPRTTLKSNNKTTNQLDYIQRTKLVHYPDIITVRFIEVSEKQSTIAIYSRSIYGRSDFGANKARIERWMAVLTYRLE